VSPERTGSAACGPEGVRPPAAPAPFNPKGADRPPNDLTVNGRDLSVEEHYRIAAMSRREVLEHYAVRNAGVFMARVRAAIRYWDGVDL
jgi:hypothetical protein